MIEDASFTAIIQAVIIQAAADARDPDPATALDAVTFFMSEDAEMWLECSGTNADPLEFVTSGKFRKRRNFAGKSDTSVLRMFEGLTAPQAQKMTALIIPTLAAIRDQVTKEANNVE